MASGFGLLADGRAFAALKVDKLSSLVTGLHSVNLATGAASVDGNGNATLSGLIVSAVPEPETHALMPAGLMGLGMMVRRRRR